MTTCTGHFSSQNPVAGILNHFERQQSLPPQVRAPDGELASDRSTRHGAVSPANVDNAEAATGQYRDFAGGATTLNEAQEKAASSLITATLARRLPVLNIQYGKCLQLVSMILLSLLKA